MKLNVLITGCCGFIGHAICLTLLNTQDNLNIYGIDNLNSYYDTNIKKNRLKGLKKNKNFFFKKSNLTNINNLGDFFPKKIDIVIHLAAQAGVRYSIEKPDLYFDYNVLATQELIKFINKSNIQKVLFASSSSIYGDAKGEMVENKFGKSKSFYASTKQFNESMFEYMCKSKSIICMRFFTVYGPGNRPDMGIFKFIKAISDDSKIYLNNYGNNYRDYTYIDDLTFLIKKSILVLNNNKKKIFLKLNFGLGKPYSTINIVNKIKKIINPTYDKMIFIKSNELEVEKTKSDTTNLFKFLKISKFKTTSIDCGLQKTFNWYKNL